MKRYPFFLFSFLGLAGCFQMYDAENNLCVIPTTNNTGLISHHIAQETKSPPQNETKKKEQSCLDSAIEEMEKTSLAALSSKIQKVDFKIEFGEDLNNPSPEPNHITNFLNDAVKNVED